MSDLNQLDRLRTDAGLHNVDFSRAALVAESNGHGYIIKFDPPVVPLGPLAETILDRTVHARSAQGAEAVLLDGLIKLHRAERQRVRLGTVCGWSSDQIARTPLSETELATYRARTSHAGEVARLQAQLAEALEQQADREKCARGAAVLSERYGLAAAHAPTETPSAAISGRPSKAKRASRQEVNHEQH
ncbi:hypothetical protein [Pseudomonas sp. 43(2021)]|uniref:hypothetical protein n=1 Tax=Pseudomonas sp. 43(2021) TaxID=2813560 RepID=UPI001A9EF4C2|nr:hypothetical protein [Pseudomonas sp. 43(2021)]